MAAARSTPPTDRRPAERFEWERIVRRIVMPANTKLLALVLATYADQDGTRVRPGNPVLAAVTGQGVATVGRQLRQLRDEYGLLEQTRRGGGRGGTKRASEHRLTIPVDLLDRVELLTPSDEPDRMRDHLAIVQSGPSPVDNSDSEITQVIAQSEPVPVDNSALNDPPSDLSIVDGNDFHRSNRPVSERLSDQIERLSDHLGDRLPPTRPTTQDHPTTPDPAQPPTARTDGSQEDHGDQEDEQPPAAPLRCDHGLPRRRRRDGKPTCALCRRDAPRSPT